MALVQALLVRALLARFAEEPYSAPLVRWGSALHERFLLPHFAMADLAEVVADLRAHDLDVDLTLVRAVPGVPVPADRPGRGGLGRTRAALGDRAVVRARRGVRQRRHGPLRRLLDRAAAGGGHRLQPGPAPADLQRPGGAAQPDRRPRDSTWPGVRYRAWKPWSALHPTLEINSPLSFDVIDRASRVRLGRCDLPRGAPGRTGVRPSSGQRAGGRGAAAARGSSR